MEIIHAAKELGMTLDFYAIVTGSLIIAFLVVWLGKRQDRQK